MFSTSRFPERRPRTSSSYAAAKCFVPMSAGFSTPTRLGYGDVSLVPLRALRQSPSTLWRPLVHVVSPPLPCQQPWPLRLELSMHSWSTRKTPRHLSLSPPHFELLPTGKEMPAKHHVRRRSRSSGLRTPAQSLSEKTSTSGCSNCQL